jgi:hypothetical protein
MRLIDKIHNEAWDNIGPKLREKFQNAQIIVADEVTEYFFALNDKEYWHTDDFPNVAPPFQSFWIETKHPSKIVSEKYGELKWDPATSMRAVRWGVLFHVIPKDSLIKQSKEWGATAFSYDDLPKFEWLLSCTLFTESLGGKIFAPWAWSIPVTKEGEIWIKHDSVTNEQIFGLSYSLEPHIKALVRQGKEGQEKYINCRHSAHTYLDPLMLAVCFMHCKNVEMQTVRPPEKLRKKHAKLGRQLFSYRVINVAPIKKMLEAARKPGETGIQLALHRCRGHFKTYTVEKPLLGKAVGTWFWHDHVRGSEKQGQVKKDYKVQRPKDNR